MSCFVETFLKTQQQVDSILLLSKTYRADRPVTVGQGGGVMTDAKEDTSPQLLNLRANQLEYTAVGVMKWATKINIATLYRPPCYYSNIHFQAAKSHETPTERYPDHRHGGF